MDENLKNLERNLKKNCVAHFNDKNKLPIDDEMQARLGIVSKK